MHWVVRGTEPDGLDAIRTRYTPRWVARYRHRLGRRPTDSRWREFHSHVYQAFSELCAYCEETTGGVIDHFRPKSKFPELVYEWTNWLLACPECNQRKRDKWPVYGYVDPCAKTTQAQPESLLTFDTTTGELLPKPRLTARRRQRATQTIYDLGLNDDHHLKLRLSYLEAIRRSLPDNRKEILNDPRYLAAITHRGKMLSSIVRLFLLEQGCVPDESYF